MADEGPQLTRRSLMAIIGAATGGTAAALGGDDSQGDLFGGTMALNQAYKAGDRLWIGPDSARTNVDAKDGRIYIGASGNGYTLYNGDSGSWKKKGLGDSSDAIPSVTTDKARFKGVPWYDVTEYGAVGDGSTDDSTAIQDAINDADGGDTVGVVYLPETGSGYRIQSKLLINKNVALIGSRPYGTKILAGSNLSGSMVVNDTGSNQPAKNIYLWGLEFDGTDGWQGLNYDPAFKCIGFKIPTTDDADTGNVVVEQVYAHDSRGTAIGIDSVPNLTVRNCIVENAGTDGETTGSNGLGIGVGEKTGRCPTWLVNNEIRDTAEYGIILEQTGDTVRSQDYKILNNTIIDARVGIGVELIRGGKAIGNTIQLSSRMDRVFIGDSLDSTIGPRQFSFSNNTVLTPEGSNPTADTAVFEWGTDATFCTGSENSITISNGMDDYRNNGSYCAWDNLGLEAAGFGSKPTSVSRWDQVGVSRVRNSDDGAVWTHQVDIGEWKQDSPADSTNLSGNTANVAGFLAYDDGTNTTGSGALCQWDGSNNQWLPFDGSSTFT